MFRGRVAQTKVSAAGLDIDDLVLYHLTDDECNKIQFNIELLFQLRELVIKYLICLIKPY